MPSRSLFYAKIIQLLINTKLKEVKPTYLVLTRPKYTNVRNNISASLAKSNSLLR